MAQLRATKITHDDLKPNKPNVEIRICAQEQCDHVLSRYNKSEFCHSCKELMPPTRYRLRGNKFSRRGAL